MKWYEALKEMQKSVEIYSLNYNTKRPHQGRGKKRRKPYELFKARLPKQLMGAANYPDVFSRQLILQRTRSIASRPRHEQ